MSLFLRDPQYIPNEVTIAADVTKGDVVQQQEVYGFYIMDQAVAERTIVTVVQEAWQVLADKETGIGETITKGDWVYLDPTNARVSATKVGLYTVWCGWAIESAGASDSDVLIRFNGTDPNRA